MFDLGWPELMVIAIVLIVVVGPKDLPRMLRSFGRTTNKLRAMAGDFRKQFDEALSEAELDEVKGLIDDARKLDPRNEIKKHLNPIEKVGQEVRAGLDAAMKPQPKKTSAPATQSDEVAKPAAAAKPAAKAAAGRAQAKAGTAKPARKAVKAAAGVEKTATARKPAAKPKSGTPARKAPKKTTPGAAS